MTDIFDDLANLEKITSVEQLEELLSRPTPAVIETMKRLDGDLMLLGACGKIGPTLARMARRASDEAGVKRRIIAVDRPTASDVKERFDRQDIELLPCDMLDREQLARLPEVPNIVYMAAMKFGATNQEPLTWAINTYLPGLACERFRNSRIVTYSTGNVYPFSPVDSGGSTEGELLEPVGDYAMSCLGRERIFDHFGRTLNIPVCLLRLNYAHELRYGVMVDLAQKIMAGQPIDVTMGYFNAIWQGDANAMALRALEHTAVPARPINLAGPDTLSVRRVAEQFADLLDQPVSFTGQEAPTALLSNGSTGYDLLGHPQVGPEQMMRWIAHWQLQGGPVLGKPTKFQVRDGKF
ncbi:MAG: NAD(P)-dependent oxidoreductase [Thermoguttaceae bacterium]|jgi:nucleoside-diphosphate-sugar epimerase|nr:NAD(P)-dependent oxidoreductase [Thermoguttaceae bacterium]